MATLCGLDQDTVTRAARHPDTVEARNVLCEGAARELGSIGFQIMFLVKLLAGLEGALLIPGSPSHHVDMLKESSQKNSF